MQKIEKVKFFAFQNRTIYITQGGSNYDSNNNLAEITYGNGGWKNTILLTDRQKSNIMILTNLYTITMIQNTGDGSMCLG